jgi:hypothetical protein
MNEKARCAVRSRLGLGAAGLLLVANVVVPVLWGDVYPFTSAPMFRDRPQHYANYRVLAPDGGDLGAEDWLVQRVYDGNPVGFGVGLAPPEVIEQEFGVVHDERTVRRHIEQQFARPGNMRHPFVEVVQQAIGPGDAERVGVVRTSRWRIERPQDLQELHGAEAGRQ